MSRTWIFLDLDGPVLDVSRRYHRVHQDLVERLGGWPFPLTAYWEAKRNQVPETEILERSGLSSEAAREAATAGSRTSRAWATSRSDIPWPWTKAALTDLARIAPLALVTLRNNPELLNWQLEVFGLSRHFTRVISGPGDGTPEAKTALLRESGISWGPDSVLHRRYRGGRGERPCPGPPHDRPRLRHPHPRPAGALVARRAARGPEPGSRLARAARAARLMSLPA